MFRISYYKDEHTRLMKVTLHIINQTIILQPGFFYKVAGVDRNVIVGCRDIEVDILIDLGFVFPSKLHTKIG
ncbi:hypothetical protein D0441_31530 [Priestia megaterium]|nr:hypothetical protein D0441_31530 [Priestia megaterium]